MAKTLKRAVSLNGQVIPAGTELTDEQAELVTNPKAFEEAGDRTGPDANDARAYQNLVRTEDNGAALRSKPKQDDDGDSDSDSGAAAGARLARGGSTKPVAQKNS